MTSPRLPNAVDLADWRRHAQRFIEAIDDGSIAEATRRANIPSVPDGYPSSTLGDGGSRGSDATSSTERAAIERGVIDQVQHGVTDACRKLGDAVHSIVWGLSGISNTHDLGESARGRQSVLVDCCEPHCEDQAIKSGRCDACRMWRHRHDGAMVPRSVIQARELRRDSTAG